MGFLCINNEIKKDVVLTDLQEEQFLRDNGLSNVNNLNPGMNFCQEIFLSPEYYVTGAIKLSSGYTSTLTGCTTGYTGIYNLDYTGDINVNFVFTGDSTFMTYEGTFCTKIFQKERWTPITPTGGLVSGSEFIDDCLTFSAITTSAPNTVIKQIDVGSGPLHMSVNTNDNRVYVSNIFSTNLSVIDGGTNEVITTVFGSFIPGRSAHSTADNILFVIGGPAIYVLDCSTNAYTGFITPILYPYYNYYSGVAYSSVDNYFYITNYVSGDVVVVDSNTQTLVGVIPLAPGIGEIIYNFNDNTFYVTNGSNSTLYVIQGLSVIATINPFYSNGPMAYNSVDNTIYIQGINIIDVVDCNTNTLLTTIPLNASYAITYDNLHNSIYVGVLSLTDNFVYRLDCTDNTVKDIIPVLVQPRGVIYNPINNYVYASEIFDDKVAVIGPSKYELSILEGKLPKTWQEYLIRPYYTFVTKECSPGIYFNSWDGMVQYNSFQSDTDYYFMTVIDPPTPILEGPNNPLGIANGYLITDRLYSEGVSGALGPQSVNGELNYFILSSIPYNGQILLILNGVQLTQFSDFDLVEQGFGVPPIVRVNGEIKTTDWLFATYVVGVPQNASIDFGAYKIETIKLDGYTTTTTPYYRPSGDQSLNYNPVTNKYEFFTTKPIDNFNSIILTVNGVKLLPNEQFFISTSFPGRIIFDENNTIFNIGDIISVLYITKTSGVNNNDYGSLSKNEFKVKWAVSPTLGNPNVTGRFIITAYDDDTNNLLFQNNLLFVEEQSNYESIFTSLPLDIYFRFEVIFEVTYTGYLGNKVITCSSSEGFFNTVNKYLSNTY